MKIKNNRVYEFFSRPYLETFQFVSEMTLSIKHQLSAQSNTISK
jgi:hypothetical protein